MDQPSSGDRNVVTLASENSSILDEGDSVYGRMGKLPEGNCKINRVILNSCPPYTEIFSKRRKICSVCVESLSMSVHHHTFSQNRKVMPGPSQ